MEVFVRETKVERPIAGAASPLVDLCWRQRGLSSAPIYKSSSLLHPSKLKGIDVAAAMLADAIRAGKRILTIADYDADGAAGAAVTVEGLRLLGGNVDFMVPDRLEHGYGLTRGAAEAAVRRRPDVVMTVGNGVTSFEGVERLRELLHDCKILITDHHLPRADGVLPAADGIVNPNQPGCEFPSKNLCGCGVALYVVAMTRIHLSKVGWFKNREMPKLGGLYDLVALGTVADVVPLDDNNRALVHIGLERIRKGGGTCRPGIMALMSVAGKDPAHAREDDMGFAVAPRLNAAGRLRDMGLGIRCLLERHADRAAKLAEDLDEMNRQMREMERAMTLDAETQAMASVAERSSMLVACFHSSNWREGVVGIIASRIRERINRPAFCFADDRGGNGTIKGSARSVDGVHIKHAMDAVHSANPDLIKRYGGHPMAADVEIEARDLERFESLMHDAVLEQTRGAHLDDGVVADKVGLSDSDLSLSNAEALWKAGPWGYGFPPPAYAGQFRVLESRVLKGKRVKMKLQPKDGFQVVDAIAFNHFREAAFGDKVPQELNCLYRLSVNVCNGRQRLQLLIDRMEDGRKPFVVRPLSKRGKPLPS